ncbi:hypothetical protein G1L02_09960 [Tenacibaculum finnmarkense]|uniref:hypothetical protein n=1 Tax=Tenacibaculum finnmarkense TaxID=2781243 RepID=UPI001EFB8E8A|nr:hypothetical protein [Tenacibaculum finnmarkense]MCG8883477.1 hypothetical protein [Tenacibaculum finnmarkense]
MKSLFLGLTFLLASFSGTTDVEKTVAEEFICSHWVEVNVECDNSFSLCTDGQTTTEVLEDAWHFSQGRC